MKIPLGISIRLITSWQILEVILRSSLWNVLIGLSCPFWCRSCWGGASRHQGAASQERMTRANVQRVVPRTESQWKGWLLGHNSAPRILAPIWNSLQKVILTSAILVVVNLVNILIQEVSIWKFNSENKQRDKLHFHFSSIPKVNLIAAVARGQQKCSDQAFFSSPSLQFVVRYQWWI